MIQDLVRVCVISCRRPENVPKMRRVLGIEPVWYVGKADRGDYARFGATHIEIGGGLCEARNKALQDSFADGKICIQVSDDLSKLVFFDGKVSKPITFLEAVDILTIELRSRKNLYFAGCAPTSNTFFFTKPYDTDKFIVGDFIAIKDSPIRFDENMKLKEDYDFTLQHLTKYGEVWRDNRILASFAHRTNRGGAVDMRTTAREQETIAYLKAKWPNAIRDNARRPNEILMRWKP